ncbi:MAG TPA: hypothetical protein VMS32_10550 [Verrucomicrobiae bacterium]|nr:hypothetical protein [Verrucomicrobiae bacterium]
MSGDTGTCDDLVLMTDVAARRAARGRPLRVTVLAPLSGWLGCGRLRVLRVKPGLLENGLILTLGYESYEKIAS